MAGFFVFLSFSKEKLLSAPTNLYLLHYRYYNRLIFTVDVSFDGQLIAHFTDFKIFCAIINLYIGGWGCFALKLEERQRKLKNIQERIRLHRRQERMTQRDAHNLNKKMRVNKLIQAGKIFEEAGILDCYDPEKMLRILTATKDI